MCVQYKLNHRKQFYFQLYTIMVFLPCILFFHNKLEMLLKMGKIWNDLPKTQYQVKLAVKNVRTQQRQLVCTSL